jgi:hypothetical protein
MPRAVTIAHFKYFFAPSATFFLDEFHQVREEGRMDELGSTAS